MKKLLALLLALCLPTGCAPKQLPEEELPALTVIGVSQMGSESGFRVANSQSIHTTFTEEAGYRLLFEDAQQKQDNQIAAIRKFIQQQVECIVLMPLCVTGWDSVLEEAKAAGIPVILVDRTIQVEDESLYAAHIGSDFQWEGEQAVGWLEETFRDTAGPVNILHIQGTLGSSAQLGRSAALEKAIDRHENWTLLAQLNGDFIQAKTYEVAAQWLDSQPAPPEIHAVYCENDNTAFGAIQALEERGYTCGPEGVRIVAFDATCQGLTYCLEGKISLEVECDPMMAPLVEEVFQLLKEGGTPDKHYYTQERLFTPEDLTREFIDQRAY